jgi:diacylglycerol kinase family enzyme
MCLNLDGEIFKAKDIRFEILPSSLKILVPKISS